MNSRKSPTTLSQDEKNTVDFRNPKGMQVAEGGDQKENELLSEYQRTAREKVPWATGCRNAGG